MRKLYGEIVRKRLFGEVRLGYKSHNGNFQAKVVEPSTADQTVIADSEYDALSVVTVKGAVLQEKTVTPSSIEQTIIPDVGSFALSKVIVEAQGDSGLLQDVTVIPSGDQQIVKPDDGYYGIGSVTVEDIPQAANIAMTMGDNVIEESTTYDDGATVSSVMTIGDNGYPVSVTVGSSLIEFVAGEKGLPDKIVVDGVECPIAWDNFVSADEGYALYNGHKFAAPPEEWDDETYPHAFILLNADGSVSRIYVVSSEVYMSEGYIYPRNDCNFLWYTLDSEAEGIAWIQSSILPRSAGNSLFTNTVTPVWTNTTILDADGTTYLAASDPVILGATPVIDAVSLGLGYAIGIARPIKSAKTVVYNLADFGGYYYSKYTSKSGGSTIGDYESAYFEAGEFPLTYTKISVLDSDDNTLAPASICYIQNLPFLAGETVKIEVLFPKTDFDVLQYDHRRIDYTAQSENIFGPRLSLMYNYNNDGSITVERSDLFESYNKTDIKNSDNQIIGFVLEGVLAVDFIAFQIADRAVNITNSKPITFSIESTFSSYDDVKITRVKEVK